VMNNEPLCRFAYGGDALTALSNHALNHYEQIIPAIKRAMDGLDTVAMASARAKDIVRDLEDGPDTASLDNLIDEAIGKNVIYFSPELNGVFWNDGKNSKPFIKNVNDDPGDAMFWRLQLADALTHNTMYRDRIEKLITA